MDEQRFALSARGDPSAEAGLVRDEIGRVWLVLPDGSRQLLSGGGSQPGALTITVTAAEIAARWDAGNSDAAIELDLPAGAIVLAGFNESNTLDGNASLQGFIGYTSGASTADVVSGGDGPNQLTADWSAGTFSVGGSIGGDVTMRANAGASIYFVIAGDNAPTTGAFVFTLLVFYA